MQVLLEGLALSEREDTRSLVSYTRQVSTNTIIFCFGVLIGSSMFGFFGWLVPRTDFPVLVSPAYFV